MNTPDTTPRLDLLETTGTGGCGCSSRDASTSDPTLIVAALETAGGYQPA